MLKDIKKIPILVIILSILASILGVATYTKRTSVEIALNTQRVMEPALNFPLDVFPKLPEPQLLCL